MDNNNSQDFMTSDEEYLALIGLAVIGAMTIVGGIVKGGYKIGKKFLNKPEKQSKPQMIVLSKTEL